MHFQHAGLQRPLTTHFRQCRKDVARPHVVTVARPDSFRDTTHYIPGRQMAKTFDPPTLTQQMPHDPGCDAPGAAALGENPTSATKVPPTDLEFDGTASEQDTLRQNRQHLETDGMGAPPGGKEPFPSVMPTQAEPPKTDGMFPEVLKGGDQKMDELSPDDEARVAPDDKNPHSAGMAPDLVSGTQREAGDASARPNMKSSGDTRENMGRHAAYLGSHGTRAKRS